MYLDVVHNVDHRKALTRLRTSSHMLAIETGRYCRPKIPINNRVCLHCNQVEDETHFILHCNRYTNQREFIFSEIVQYAPTFLTLDTKQKFAYIMSEVTILKFTAKYCYVCTEIRKNDRLSTAVT